MRKAIYKIIIDDLLAEIESGKLKPGDRVWSIREIEERYKVSQITALRVFRELAGAGRIVRRDGTGYYVSSPRGAERGNAIVAAFRPLHKYNTLDNYGNRILDGIMRGAFAENFELRIPPAVNFLRSRVPSELETRRLAEEIGAMTGVAGVIFDFRFSDEILQKILLPACHGAQAVVAGRSTALPIASVSVPMESCGTELAQLALRCGGKRFFLFPYQGIADNALLMEAFRAELLRNGVTPEVIRETPDANLSRMRNEELFAEIEAMVRTDGGRPILFCSTDSWGRELCDRLAARGLRVRDDFGVLTFGGYETAFTHTPKLTCAAVNAERIGLLASEAIIAENKTPGTHFHTDYKIILNDTL